MRVSAHFVWLSTLALSLGWQATAQAVVLDSYAEDFESRTADATIHDQESWTVTAGSTSDALVQSSVTPRGTGKALKLAGAMISSPGEPVRLWATARAGTPEMPLNMSWLAGPCSAMSACMDV